jgi:hypothetical protein
MVARAQPLILLVCPAIAHRTTLSVIEGIIYFQEYRELDLTAGIVFFAALLVIFFGVFLLSSGGGGSSKSYAPVPSSEENWDPTDPTTPRCAAA